MWSKVPYNDQGAYLGWSRIDLLSFRTFRGSLYHKQLMVQYLVCIFCMFPCIFSMSSCLCTCPSSLAFCISWLEFCRCSPPFELIFHFLKCMLARPVVFWGQGSTGSYQKVAIMKKTRLICQKCDTFLGNSVCIPFIIPIDT